MRISILRCLEASDQKIRSLTYIKIKFYLMGHVFKAETLEKFKPHIWLQLQQKMSSGLRTKIILRLSPAVRSLVSSEDEYCNNYELDRPLIGLLRWFLSSGGEVTYKNKLEILWECTAVQCSHCEISNESTKPFNRLSCSMIYWGTIIRIDRPTI